MLNRPRKTSASWGPGIKDHKWGKNELFLKKLGGKLGHAVCTCSGTCLNIFIQIILEVSMKLFLLTLILLSGVTFANNPPASPSAVNNNNSNIKLESNPGMDKDTVSNRSSSWVRKPKTGKVVLPPPAREIECVNGEGQVFISSDTAYTDCVKEGPRK